MVSMIMGPTVHIAATCNINYKLFENEYCYKAVRLSRGLGVGVTGVHVQYSQISHKWTPLGPGIAVSLQEVFTYKRFKNTKHHGGQGVAVMPSDQCFRLIHVKFLSMHKNVIMVKLSLINFESYQWVLKPANSHSLDIFSSTVCLWEVILAMWTSKCQVLASTYERCPFMGG